MEIFKTLIALICIFLCIIKIYSNNIINKNYKAITCLSLSRNALTFEKVRI